MSRIEDRLRERSERWQNETAIANAIDPIWDSLSKEIGRLVERYSSAVQSVEKASRTVATTEEVEISIKSDSLKPLQNQTLRTARLRLDRKTKTINMTFFRCQSRSDLPRQIRFGIDENGEACLLDDSGNPISIPEAARRICDPLFFHDLPPSS
jgi:hypothetical protein